MNTAVSYLVGSHDFAAFVPVAQAGDSVRTVYDAACHREDDVIAIDLRASGFKQQMVRTIAGTLVQVGAQRLRPDDMTEILRSRDRKRAGDTMPACGLYLVAVRYPAGTLGERTSGDLGPGAAHLFHGYEEKA